jgi:hypothetical protein
MLIGIVVASDEMNGMIGLVIGNNISLVVVIEK